ncbi:metalloendopeptidase [Calothrix sp. HK-06]|nr:metalloendopeptidase [Calothrix sp. HK-06]
MPESKSKFLIPAIGAAAVAVGGIAAYMYFFKGPSGDSSGAIASARVVPSDALVATYITTDPQAWSKLQQFGTPEAQKVVTNSLEAFNKTTLADGNISYEKDLKPWIGGVMVALLPSNPVKPTQATPQATQEPNVLMVVGIKDKVSALNLANRLKSQKDVKSQEIDYKGEKITETQGQGKPTYSAIVNNNNYLVFSQDKRSIEQAINTVKGEPSFASKQGASEILSKGVNVQNAVAQIYVPDYASMFEQLIKNSSQATQIPRQTLDQLKQVKSMVAGIGIDNDGVRMKAVANIDPKLLKYKYEPSSSKVVSQFPANTLALVSGQGISRWWKAVTEESKNYPELNQALQQARGQLQSVSLDLDKDVFGWMDGEFGLAAIPSDQGVLAGFGFGGAFVFDTSDRKTAEATFSKIDNIVKTQNVNVQARKIGDRDITEWQIPNQGGLLAHGWLDQDTVFIALGGPIADTLAVKGIQPLDNSDSFKAITGSLQRPNGGYLYIDMDKTMSIVNKFASAARPIPPDTAAILNSIRGIGVTANSNNESTTQMEMLLSLKPKTAK